MDPNKLLFLHFSTPSRSTKLLALTSSLSQLTQSTDVASPLPKVDKYSQLTQSMDDASPRAKVNHCSQLTSSTDDGSAPVNTCLVEQLTTGCSSDVHWLDLLTKPFHALGSWYTNLDLNTNFLPIEHKCLCNVKHSGTTQTLVKVAIYLFGVSWKLQNNLKQFRLTNGNAQHIHDEHKAMETLLDAAKIINSLLGDYVDDVIPLETYEFDFCLRAISFIEDHLILFDYYNEFYTFWPLSGLIKKQLDNESKLKLATLLIEYSIEYEKVGEMDEFFRECEDLHKNPNISISPKTKLNFSACMGLKYKRLSDNVRGNEYLKPICNEAICKVVHLKYLATKRRKTEGMDLVKPEAKQLNPQAYIRSIQVTNTFYECDEDVKMVVAALQAISKAKVNSLTEANKSSVAKFITDVLNVCEQLGLRKQSVNLLLVLASYQMGEPHQFQVKLISQLIFAVTLFKIRSSLTVDSIHHCNVITIFLSSIGNCPVHMPIFIERSHLF